MKWDDDQSRVIYAPDGDILVTASAGSGKTSVMIERIFSKLSGQAEDGSFSLHKVPIERMLIVTFTKASASDMRQKLNKRITECLAYPTCDKPYLLSQMFGLAGADMSTLHSFCQSLIRKYSYIIGIDPAFTVIDTTESELRMNRVLNETFLQAFDTVPGFFEVFDLYSTRSNDKALKTIIKSLYTFAFTQDEPEKFFELCRDSIDYPEAAAMLLQEALNNIRAMLKVHGRRGSPRFSALCAELTLAMDRGEDISGLLDDAGRQICDEPFLSEIKALEAELAKLNKEFDKIEKHQDNEHSREYIKTIVDTAVLFAALYKSDKSADSVLDYSDLEHYAKELMQNAAVGETVRNGFEYVFVDEYQDINPIQERIISLVCSGGNRFVVGDMKQSIYRFRLCDPMIFANRLKLSAADGTAYPLNRNFRSSPKILEFSNIVFSRLMTGSFGSVGYAADAMFVPFVEPAEADYPRVSVFVLQGGQKRQKKDAERKQAFIDAVFSDGVYSKKKHCGAAAEKAWSDAEAEAAVIYRQIVRIIRDVTIDGRAARLSDIVILSRSVTAYAKKVGDTLVKLGIPVTYTKKTQVFECPPVALLINILKLINNPHDDYPLFAALKSGLGDISDIELASIRLAYPADKFFYMSCQKYTAEKSDEIAAKLKAFYSKLEELILKSSYMSVGELLAHIKAVIGLEQRLYADPDGQRLRDIAEGFILNAMNSLRGKALSSYIDYLDKDVSLETPELAYADNDSVRIMSVHASKGLEFPVVIFMGTGVAFRADYPPIQINKEHGIAIYNFDTESRTKERGAEYLALSLIADKESMEEELRVMYIALTRAKEHLIITGVGVDNSQSDIEPVSLYNAKSFMDWLQRIFVRDNTYYPDNGHDNSFTSGGVYKLSVFDINLAKEYLDNAAEAAPAMYIAPDNDIVKQLGQLKAFKYPYSTDIPAKTTVTAINASDAEDKYYDGEHEPGVDPDRAAAAGTAYHIVFEHIDYNIKTPGEIARFIAELTEDGCLPAGLAEHIDIEKIYAAINSDIIKRAAAGTAYREKKFMLYAAHDELFNSKQQDRVLVQGVIDLLIVEDDGCIIVDFKTTRASKDAIAASNAKQLALYAFGVERIMSMPVKAKIIYSLHNSCEIHL